MMLFLKMPGKHAGKEKGKIDDGRILNRLAGQPDQGSQDGASV